MDEAHAIEGLAVVAAIRNAREDAAQLYEEARALYVGLGSRDGEARVLRGVSDLDVRNGAYHEADLHLKRALSISRDIGIDLAKPLRSAASLNCCARRATTNRSPRRISSRQKGNSAEARECVVGLSDDERCTPTTMNHPQTRLLFPDSPKPELGRPCKVAITRGNSVDASNWSLPKPALNHSARL